VAVVTRGAAGTPVVSVRSPADEVTAGESAVAARVSV
jgi:hypothetical protein